MQVSRALENAKVDEIKKLVTLIKLAPRDTVSSAFQVLSKRGITAIAIYDEQKDIFLGFVDTIDLAVFVVQVFLDNHAKHPHLYDPKELDQRFQLPLQEVINASRRNVLKPIDKKENLSFLIKNFVQFRVHRVPVSDEGRIIGIVSQSDIVKYLLFHKDLYKEFMIQKISDLLPNVAYKPLVSIRYDHTLLQAFTTIISSGITGLPVTDLHGRLVNNLSASDLKGITEQSFFKLEIPIHEILSYRTGKLPPVVCTDKSTLMDVMEKINKTGVHRVWMVDEDFHPIGVVTLTDILQIFATNCFSSNPI